MSRFTQIKQPDTPELQALYDQAVQAGWGTPEGRPINWFTSLGERPDILDINFMQN